MSIETAQQRNLLGSAEIRRMLSDYVRRRVPEADVDDVVQTVLVEALASDTVPDEKAELRKWLTGVARHKIADHHRRAGRERPAELPEIETTPAPIEEQELARWAEKQAKGSKESEATLRWMAREGDGDKLEHIAAEEKLPAATVRQRVSRMRRWMRERWLAEVAAAAAVLGLAIYLVYRFSAGRPTEDVAKKEPPSTDPTVTSSAVVTGRAPSPVERAVELRREALGECDRAPEPCLQKLEEAKRLDPAGDSAPEIQDARRKANDRAQPQRDPEPQPSAIPSTQPSAEPDSTSLQKQAPYIPPTSSNLNKPPKAPAPTTPNSKKSPPSEPAIPAPEIQEPPPQAPTPQTSPPPQTKTGKPQSTTSFDSLPGQQMQMKK